MQKPLSASAPLNYSVVGSIKLNNQPAKEKGFSAIALILTLFVSAVAGAQTVNVGRANPLPDIEPVVVIENPPKATYNRNTITLNFTVASNWGIYSVFYSLDGQNMTPIEDLTVVSQEDVNIGKSPRVDRVTLRGSCVLPNLSEGWHNVTIYQIYQFETYEKHETGDILSSATTEFMIDTFSLIEVLPITFVAVIGFSLLVYLKKRKSKR